MDQERYVGRFAPSPSGPLHLGSLCTALGSYLRAKSMNGSWLVRIEDIDTPRVAKGASDSILKTLDKLGFEIDGEIVFQSKRHEAYERSLEFLRQHRSTYGCKCSRKLLKTNGFVHPISCRQKLIPPEEGIAERFLNPGTVSSFNDGLLGEVSSHGLSDFILKRSDGIYAYNLAVVTDDQEFGVNEIVRGADLIPVTADQINLYLALGFDPPKYVHLPLIVSDDGRKYSKQNGSKPVDCMTPGYALILAAKALGQPTDELDPQMEPREILSQLMSRFDISRVPVRECCVEY